GPPSAVTAWSETTPPAGSGVAATAQPKVSTISRLHSSTTAPGRSSKRVWLANDASSAVADIPSSSTSGSSPSSRSPDRRVARRPDARRRPTPTSTRSPPRRRSGGRTTGPAAPPAGRPASRSGDRAPGWPGAPPAPRRPGRSRGRTPRRRPRWTRRCCRAGCRPRTGWPRGCPAAPGPARTAAGPWSSTGRPGPAPPDRQGAPDRRSRRRITLAEALQPWPSGADGHAGTEPGEAPGEHPPPTVLADEGVGHDAEHQEVGVRLPRPVRRNDGAGRGRGFSGADGVSGGILGGEPVPALDVVAGRRPVPVDGDVQVGDGVDGVGEAGHRLTEAGVDLVGAPPAGEAEVGLRHQAVRLPDEHRRRQLRPPAGVHEKVAVADQVGDLLVVGHPFGGHASMTIDT